ncbi:MAG TPA: DUF2785 domain-containing protein [Candidatus Binatia bacterium]|nr:DUF2785 domain-containing protein [Candidatus Binatia bacterium]
MFLRPAIVLLLLIGFASAHAHAAQPKHDKDFWRGILKQHAAVPENESADALAHELSAMLASPDPELRDDLAYSILATWIYRGNVLSTPTLIALTDEWRTNLKSGIGESGTDSVLKRSFSALCLSEIARREVKSPFLGPERYHNLVAEAVAYLQDEHDLRGYDRSLHWIHATAHTGDLLAALSDNPQLTKQEADAILQAIRARLATATEVFTQGEQDRLAAAAVSVIRRKEFDGSEFSPWLARFQEEDRDIWTHTTPESLARFQNHNYLLQALTVRILMEPDSPLMYDHRQQVVQVLSKR